MSRDISIYAEYPVAPVAPAYKRRVFKYPFTPRSWGGAPYDEAWNHRLWIDPEVPELGPLSAEEHFAMLEAGQVVLLRLVASLTSAGEWAFSEAFAEEMARLVPAYNMETDCEAADPWCCPWTSQRLDVWYVSTLTVRQMGKRWARMCAPALRKVLVGELESE